VTRVSIDEMVDELRALIADRNTSERQRVALQMAIRLSLRGKHLSSTRLPAVSNALQNFVKVREIMDDARDRLTAGLDQIAGAGGPEAPSDPDDE